MTAPDTAAAVERLAAAGRVRSELAVETVAAIVAADAAGVRRSTIAAAARVSRQHVYDVLRRHYDGELVKRRAAVRPRP